MSDIPGILEPSCTKVSIEARSRKAVLQYASDLLAETYELPARKLFDELMNRERLGSTALGEGIAIPHCRLSNCSAPVITLVTLDEAVDFDAADGRPVDILFMLLVPEEAHQRHLDILAEIARLFSQDDYCRRLRAARNDRALFTAATGDTG